jgi:F-box protein 9
MENSDSALEQFRRQWREEVNAKAKSSKKRQTQGHVAVRPDPSASSEEPKVLIARSKHHLAGGNSEAEDVDHYREERPGIADQPSHSTLGGTIEDDEFSSKKTTKEPKSALEHFERAIEKEDQGNFGDSVSHYRKAYRLDAAVDLTYRNKHFPPKSKIGDPNPSNAPVTVPSTAHHSSKEPIEVTSISTLVANFAGLSILGAPPIIEGDPPPACPISRLPPELLLEILLITAILDPASFTRLALVCKGLAYRVFAEKQIWKRVALGPEFGLAGQLYDFQTDLQGRESTNHVLGLSFHRLTKDESTFDDPVNQDWREVFRSHPRIRFTGVYISTVNYTRAGGASASQTTWNTPVHIVTYYRYLRFFRDGTVISLLSCNEPIEVVHHLTKENVALIRGGKEHHPLNFTSSAPAINGPSAPTGPPTAHQLMKHALRGRWRLYHPSAAEERIGVAADTARAGMGGEGDVFIETEGAGPRYMYTMQLALKSSSKSKHGVRNNKLQWKGFWSHNQRTDDWFPFHLKNDRAFFFSRVKSYGLGY